MAAKTRKLTTRLVGETFGELEVLEPTEERTSQGNIVWLCKCSCGKLVKVGTHSLNSGDRRSCGHLFANRMKMTEEERKDRKRAREKAYLLNNPHQRKKRREQAKARYRNKKVHHIRVTRNCRLKRLYGITTEEYNLLLRQQKYACAICKEACSTGNSLAVDHDHKTGKIRGLLCHDCNVSLGHMRNDPERLRKAAQYLEDSGDRCE